MNELKQTAELPYTGSEETGGTSVSRTFKRTSTDGGLLSFQANNQKNSNIES